MNQDNVDFVTVGAGENARNIAFAIERGTGRPPSLFWLGGFKSSMFGEKANALSQEALQNGQTYTRLDYSGHGQSGGEFVDGTISKWLEEAQAVFEQKTQGPQVLVGSSMGGWLALLLALKLAGESRIHGMILIAPAWDMTEDLMWQRFSGDIRNQMEKDGFYDRPSAYGDEHYGITKALIEDGRTHLIKGQPLSFGFPIHILHGSNDPDVPWQHGQALMNLLPEDEVRFTLVPGGDHRLSTPDNLELIKRVVREMSG